MHYHNILADFFSPHENFTFSILVFVKRKKFISRSDNLKLFSIKIHQSSKNFALKDKIFIPLKTHKGFCKLDPPPSGLKRKNLSLNSFTMSKKRNFTESLTAEKVFHNKNDALEFLFVEREENNFRHSQCWELFVT
jgi:hypothetical protein